MNGPAWSALRPGPDDADQVVRLARFREQHPDVMIVAGNGWWQASIPDASSLMIITRYSLRGLLDKLDERDS